MKRIEMPELTSEFVLRALEVQSVWDLGNNVLYDLCANHPGHGSPDVIIAKTWLIGRAYAAALERRRAAVVVGDTFNEVVGDDFYEVKVVKCFMDPSINTLFRDLKTGLDGCGQKAVEAHKILTDKLKKITGLQKRSFSSKYLHFHFPDKFYIFDSRSNESSRRLTRIKRRHGRPPEGVDTEYADFCARCEQLSGAVSDLLGRRASPRELDKIFLHHWSEANSRNSKAA